METTDELENPFLTNLSLLMTSRMLRKLWLSYHYLLPEQVSQHYYDIYWVFWMNNDFKSNLLLSLLLQSLVIAF